MNNIYNTGALFLLFISAWMIFDNKNGFAFWVLLLALMVWTYPDTIKNKKRKSNKELIKSLEGNLVRYKEELAKNPNSTFHKGCVKNLEEWIEELKGE